MDNKYVDILLIVSCIIGFVIGILIANYGVFIYNLIFFILIMAILLILIYKN
jgi:hypothetical protein